MYVVSGEVWQLFQDAFELMEEPSDTIFVIRIEDQKKVIGGRKAEEQVITFLDKEGDNLRGLRIEIFVNYIPSVQFVRDLVHIKARNQQALPMLSNNACDVHIDVIISGNFEDSTETNQEALEMLSNNGYAAREFAEDDWDELAKTLLLPADGINPQKALERKEFKTYLEKSKGTATKD